MAEFNLGRIKGEKGDTGPKGEKGDTGAKGEKGEKGDNGSDGYTPVFSVGEVTTLENGENALVEIDSSNPENPVLTFRIPRGKDGTDAYGDMQRAVYDTTGMETDVFEYARNLVAGCLKNEGGNLTGKLTAAECPLSERAVRNISVASVLPETGAEGDIVIIVHDQNPKTLADCNEGDVVLLKENGKDKPYVVIGKDYHKQDTVTLIRKELYPGKLCYDYANRGGYIMSDIDIFLETMLIMVFPCELRKNFVPTRIEINTHRHCFLLKSEDYTSMNYFSESSKRAAYIDSGTSRAKHITATVGTDNKIIAINGTGDLSTADTQSAEYFRPAVVLPKTFPVVNVSYNGSYAVTPVEVKAGVYIRMDGAWKECALL